MNRLAALLIGILFSLQPPWPNGSTAQEKREGERDNLIRLKAELVQVRGRYRRA